MSTTMTIGRCARKTEVALWPHLFSVVGSPRQLFMECIGSHDLETAASYLLILQNLEPPAVAQSNATILLDAALDRCSWDLAKELVRFHFKISKFFQNYPKLFRTCPDFFKFFQKFGKLN